MTTPITTACVLIIGNEILSGKIIIKKNDKWIRVWEHDKSEYIGKNTEICYHYIKNSFK